MRTAGSLLVALLLLPAFVLGPALHADEEGHPAIRRWHALYDDAWDLYKAGDLDEAIAAFEEAFQHAVDARLSANAGEAALLGLVNCYGARWDFVNLRDVSDRLLSVQRAIGESEAILKTLLDLTYCEATLGNYETGLIHLDEALRRASEMKNPNYVAAALLRRADLEWGRGRLVHALADVQDCVELYRDHGSPADLGEALMLLGNIQAEVGDFDGAERAYEDALALQLDKPSHLAFDLRANLALLSVDRGEPDEALVLLQKILEEHVEKGDDYTLALILYGLGRAHKLRGETHDALDAWKRVRELQPTLPIAFYATLSMAEVHLEAGRAREARDLLDSTVEEAERLGERDLLAEFRRLQALVCLEQGNAEGARAHVIDGIDQLTEMATGLPPTVAPNVREKRADLFALARRVAFARDHPGAALDLFERMRGASLVAHLRDAGYRPPEESDHPAVKRAREGVRAAQQRLDAARQSGDRPAIRRASTEREDALGVYRQALQDQQIRRGREKRLAGAQPASLAEVTGALGPDDALVLYASDGERLHALVVEQERVRAVALAPVADVDEAVRRIRLGMETVEPVDTESLRALVLDPLDLSEDLEALVVCPDGCLWEAPFALLAPGHDVALTPSATAYALLSSHSFPPGRGVLALGAPVYGRSEGGLRRRGPSLGSGLGDLPGSEAEAKSAAGENGVCLLGRHASEAAWLEALRTRTRWRAVHFACHGVLDQEHPAWSALALTPDTEHDGWLTAVEVFSIEVPSDLVVLSACNTGRGADVAGEGLFGLVTAFLHAGSPRVLASLWPVDDEATSELMGHFHEVWRREAADDDPERASGAAAALRAAQEHVRTHPDHPEWSHPHYWAAWVLWGLPD